MNKDQEIVIEAKLALRELNQNCLTVKQIAMFKAAENALVALELELEA